MKEVKLNDSISTLIDDEVADLLEKHGLGLRIERGGYIYVYGSLHNFVAEKKRDDIRQVDHINRDILDNRRENLRIVSRSDNMKNRIIPLRITEAKYYCYVNQTKRWRVLYPKTGKMFGEYNSEGEAEHAVKRMLSGAPREITLKKPSSGLPKYIHKVQTFGTEYYQVRPIVDGKREYVGSYKTLEEAKEQLNHFNRRIKE